MCFDLRVLVCVPLDFTGKCSSGTIITLLVNVALQMVRCLTLACSSPLSILWVNIASKISLEQSYITCVPFTRCTWSTHLCIHWIFRLLYSVNSSPSLPPPLLFETVMMRFRNSTMFAILHNHDYLASKLPNHTQKKNLVTSERSWEPSTDLQPSRWSCWTWKWSAIAPEKCPSLKLKPLAVMLSAGILPRPGTCKIAANLPVLPTEPTHSPIGRNVRDEMLKQ